MFLVLREYYYWRRLEGLCYRTTGRKQSVSIQGGSTLNEDEIKNIQISATDIDYTTLSYSITQISDHISAVIADNILSAFWKIAPSPAIALFELL